MSQTAKAGSKTPSRPPLTLLQILAIIGIVAGLLIMLDFNRRQAEAQRLVADRNRLGTEVAHLEYERSVLQTQVAYATTDAAVIDWAHQHGKLVQEGEVLVVPVMPTVQPTPVPNTFTPPPAPDSWRLWWNLFFDAAPPLLP